MKTYKQLVENFFIAPSNSPIDFGSYLSNFKQISENNVNVYIDENLQYGMKFEKIHKKVTKEGYRYNDKSYKSNMTVEHTYVKESLDGNHYLKISVHGIDEDVWKVEHETILQEI
jgi:hypothetical protein